MIRISESTSDTHILKYSITDSDTLFIQKGGEIMFCPNCGKEINDSSNYCLYCGHKFAENSINYIKGINAIIDIVYFNLFTQIEHFSDASVESLYSPTNSYIELKYLSMKSL